MLAYYEELVALQIKVHHLLLHKLRKVRAAEIRTKDRLRHLYTSLCILSKPSEPHTYRSVILHLHQPFKKLVPFLNKIAGLLHPFQDLFQEQCKEN